MPTETASARDQLAEAHKRMSPKLIAEHALALARALEQTTEAYNLAVGMCRHNLSQARKAVDLAHTIQRATRGAANFVNAGKPHLALAALLDLASIEMVDLVMVEGDEANYVEIEHEPEMFNPPGDL